MEFQVQTVTLLLLVAAVVAMLTRRLRLPYSVGLVAAGIILAISPFAPKIELTKDLLFTPPFCLRSFLRLLSIFTGNNCAGTCRLS